MSKRWWRRHKMRIYHPNAREWEMGDLDVERFVAECVATHAESIVVSAGGIYAFYPTEVPYHHVSATFGERDLMQAITKRAHAKGLRVIARVDYSKAREDVWRDHPEWFQRDAVGAPIRSGDYYATCPAGAYQGDAFALPVLVEILDRYGVDGFHINAAGYHGYCYCTNCRARFGQAIPTDAERDPEAWQAFLWWRARMVADQITLCRHTLRDMAPDIYFMGEVAGPQRAEWADSAAHHVPSLSRAFSQLLLTAGDFGSRDFRWWVSVAAQLAENARRKRYHVINVKLQMRREGRPHASMPAAEFTFHAAQALANNAGLKVPTFGLPEHQRDPRSLPALAKVFGYMAEHEDVLDTMLPIRDVALVWPGRSAAEPNSEFQGLYAALLSRHVLLGIMHTDLLSLKALRRFRTVVIPSSCDLSDDQRLALLTFIDEGGRLVLTDGDSEDVSPIARELGVEALPGDAQSVVRYALVADAMADALPGPLPLFHRYHAVTTPDDASVWVSTARAGEIGIPEDLGDLDVGDEPLVLSIPCGAGSMVYAGMPLGRAYAETGHPDYALLLQCMVVSRDEEPPLLVTDAPTTVQVTMAHWYDGVVISLVNGTGSAPLGEAVPVGPITLDLAWDGPGLARWCPLGKKTRNLKCEEAWNRIKVVVPRLEAFGQVVVRSA